MEAVRLGIEGNPVGGAQLRKKDQLSSVSITAEYKENSRRKKSKIHPTPIREIPGC